MLAAALFLSSVGSYSNEGEGGFLLPFYCVPSSPNGEVRPGLGKAYSARKATSCWVASVFVLAL